VSIPPKQQSYDAVIVGGGVIGLSCAWRAVQRGARVAVIDKARLATGATHVAAGMLAPVGELAFGEPKLLELTTAAAELYPGFIAELEAAIEEDVPTGYNRCGALHLALDRDEAAELRRVHELQRSLGLAAEWLPPRRCRELEPGLTPSINGGVHAPDEASVDPRALARALLAALALEGVAVRTGCEVVGGLFEGERLVGVEVADGGASGPGTSRPAVGGGVEQLRAGAVLLASGAWSGQAEWLPEPARPPVRPVKGQILTLRTRDGSSPCERILASERVYLVPRPDGRLIVGATVEEQGFDTAVTAGGVHELLREAYRLLPEVAEMELVDATAGLRPGTPDNLPLVGPSPVGGLFWATGHYRNGILLAPHTANVIADLLNGDVPDNPAASASPARSLFVSHSATNSERTAETAP
jgi:glycine oxidase